MSDARPAVHFAIPGDLDTATGGYAYDRALLEGLPAFGVDIDHVALPAGYPAPDANDIAETERLISALPKHDWLLIDGLAFGAMPEDLVAALPHRIAALVHHPLALETGLPAETAARLVASEHAALAHADAVIATSAATGHILERDYAVPAAKLALARPGIARRARARSEAGATPRLLAVGAISERKGYDVLVDALAMIRDEGWTLDIVGDTDRTATATRNLERQIMHAHIGDRITLRGEVGVSDLDRLFRTSDLFVMPSRFEGYGMVVSEAVAYGLPVVSTDQVPAAAELPSAAVTIVPTDDAERLGLALRDLIVARDHRAAMADAAWAHAASLPRWEDTCAAVATIFKEATP